MNFISQKLRQLLNRRKSAKPCRAEARRALRAEMLEDRRLLAVTLVDDNFDRGVPSALRTYNAVWQGQRNVNGWVQLTSASNGQTGSLVVNNHSQAAQSFDVRFNQSIKDSTSAEPGDGIAFGYGALPDKEWGNSGPGTFDGQGSPRADGVFVKFDTYPNVGSIEVYYNQTRRARWIVPIGDGDGVGENSLRNTFQSTRIRMSDSTKVLSISHPAFGTRTGSVGTRNVRISDWEPSRDWRFGWGASTGAANDRHIIEDAYVRDTTANTKPEVTYEGSDDEFTDDVESLPFFSWRVRDYNVDANDVSITLQKLEDGNWVDKWTQDTDVSTDVQFYTHPPSSNIPYPKSSDVHTLQMNQRDLEQFGLGVYRGFVEVRDLKGLTTTAASPGVTVIDDDDLGPEITVTLDGAQVDHGGNIQLQHDQVSLLTWSVSDDRTGNSGVSSAEVELLRDGQVVLSSSNTAGFFDLSNIGPGNYSFRTIAFDNDEDRGIGTATDLSSSEFRYSLDLLNTAPTLRLGTDRTAVQGQSVILSPLEASDPNGDAVSVAWSFDAGTTFNEANPVVQVFEDVGTYSVLARAQDEYGAETFSTLDVVVENAPPRIEAVNGGTRFGTGEVVSLQVLAVDGPAETLTYNVDWNGDGQIDESNTTGAFSSLLEPGIHVPRFAVTDDYGLSSSSTFAVLVGPQVSNPPVVGITSQTVNFDEGQSATVDLVLSEASTGDVAVQLGIAGDAVRSDYTLSNSVVVIPAGETRISIEVQASLDGIDELNESLNVSVSDALGATFDAQQVVGLEIVDVDPTPKAWFVGGNILTNELERSLRIGVQLSNPTSRDIRIPLEAAGSATLGVDLRLSDSEVFVPAGQLFGAIDVTILDDAEPEVLEATLLQLKATQNVLLADDPSVATNKLIQIQANDAPRIEFTQLYREVSEADGSVTLTAMLSAPPATPVFAYATVGGNADLVGSPQTLEFEFQPGQQSASVNLAIVNDQVPELETFLVADFVDVDGATLGPGRRFVAAIQDDDFATLQFATSNRTLTESSTRFQVDVLLDKPLPENTVFPVTIRGGNAHVGSDFILQDDPNLRTVALTIPAGANSAFFEITILEDRLIEQDEAFTLELGQPLNEIGEPGIAILGAQNTFRTVIKNDDASAYVSGVDRTVTEGQGSIDITVGLSGPMDERVDVILILRGTSEPGREVRFDDGASKTIPFFPGETRKGLKIYIIDDDRGGEPSEYVDVIVQTTIPVIGKTQRLVITDVDQINAEFASADSHRFENEGPIRIPIRLNGGSDQETAILVKDPRRDEPDLITIPPGVEEVIYEAPLEDNGGFDVKKNILFRIVAGAGVNVDPSRTHNAIVEDDEVEEARTSSNVQRQWDYARWVDGRSLDAWFDDVETKAADLLGFDGGRLTWQELGNSIIEQATDRIPQLIIDQGIDLACTATGVAAEAGAFAASKGATGALPTVIQFAVQQACTAIVTEVVAEFGDAADQIISDQLKREYAQVFDDLKDAIASVFIATVDGPLVGGTLFFDANFNATRDFVDTDADGYRDPGEPEEPSFADLGGGIFGLNVGPEFDRNANGLIDPEDGQLVLTGAIDTSTGLLLQTPLTAPFGSSVVSPLTTLAASLIDNADRSAEDAESIVLNAFDIPAGEGGHRLYVDNPIIDTFDGEADAAVAFRAGAIVHNTIDQIAGFLAGIDSNPGERTIGIAAYEALASALTSGPVQLSNAFVLDGLITRTASTLGLTVSAAESRNASIVIAEGNVRIDEIPLVPNINFMEQVAAVQTVAQGAIAEELKEYASGDIGATTLLANNTGEALTQLVKAAEVGTLVESDLTIGDAQYVEADDGSKLMQFEVNLSLPSKDGVSVEFNTVEAGSASDGLDYQGTFGELTWEPGEEGVKIIEVPIFGDTEFEGTELFEVWLGSPQNATISRQAALGRILDNDALRLDIDGDAEVTISVLEDQLLLISKGTATLFAGQVSTEQAIELNNIGDTTIEVSIDVNNASDSASRMILDGGAAGFQLLLANQLARQVVHQNSGVDGRYVSDGLEIEYSDVVLLADPWGVDIELPSELSEGTAFTASLSDELNAAFEAGQADWSVTEGTPAEFSPNGSEVELLFDDNQLAVLSVLLESEFGPNYQLHQLLIIENAAPAINSFSAPVINEDGVAIITGSFSDASPEDTHSVVIDWGDGSTSFATVDQATRTFTAAYQYLDDDPSETPSDDYQVGIMVTDDDAGDATALTKVTVNNVAPVIDSLATEVIQASGLVTLSGVFSDQGTQDSHQVVIDWGDGNSSFADVDQSTESFTASYDYETGGFFEILVTLIDDDQGIAVTETSAFAEGVGRVGDVLWIIGTEEKDKIKIDRKDRDKGTDRREVLEVDANLDGNKSKDIYELGDLSSLHIVTFGGKDNVDVKKDVGLPVTVASGTGDDKIKIASGAAIIFAGAGKDKVDTADGNDFVDGGEGNDDINTGGGDDTIFDPSGDNKVDAGDGNDSVTVGDGDDQVKLGGGDDVVWLGAGNDDAKGEDGNDLLFGELGNDKLDGGKGNDIIVGGAGDDRIEGDRGSDLLIGGFGADRIGGGKDDDLLIAGWTIYDSDVESLNRVLEEWTSDSSYAERTNNLNTGAGSLDGVQFQSGTTVFDDASQDRLDGESGRDWFFAALADHLVRLKEDELLELL